MAENNGIKITYISIIGNAVLALVKGVAGVFGNSYALVADAIESTGDVFSSMLVLFGLKYVNKPADENHPYGHGRIEPLITFAVVGFLILSATVITYKSIENIRTPHALPKPYTLLVLVFVIIIKEIFYRKVLRTSTEIKSTALKADAWHHRSDALTSLAAFIGISIALIFGKGYETADDWAALVSSGIIFFNAYLIFRTALSEVMDEHVYDDLTNEIRKISQQVDGVMGTEKCRIRKSGLTYFVDLHILVKATRTVKEGHDIAHDLKNVLRTRLPQISDVLIHVEPEE